MNKKFELTPEYIERLRQKLESDSSYAEKFLQLVTEEEKTTLKSVWTKSELPYTLKNDPKAIIVMLTGYNPKTKRELIMILLDNRENIREWSAYYPTFVWKPYNPISDSDFMKLPDVYPIIFEMNETNYPEEPLFRARMTCINSEEPIELDDGVKINLINTNADSKIMRMLSEF